MNGFVLLSLMMAAGFGFVVGVIARSWALEDMRFHCVQCDVTFLEAQLERVVIGGRVSYCCPRWNGSEYPHELHVEPGS